MKAYMHLRRLTRLNALIDNKLLEKQKILELATKITPNLSGLPRPSGVSDKVGNAALQLAAVEAEIDRAVDRLVDARKEVLAMLETLPTDEYHVLHQYFVLGRTVEAIADCWQPKPRTERQVYRIKAKAIKHVQAILDAQKQ